MAAPLRLNRNAVVEALQNPATLGLTLAFIMESLVEPAVLYGDADTDPADPVAVIVHLEREFGVDMPPAVENRIQAVMLLRTSAAFETSVQAFIAVALALYDGYLGDMPTGVMEDVDIGEALWAVFEAACIDPHLQNMSDEVEVFLLDLAAAPVDRDGDGAEDDEMADVLRRMELLQHQLLTLEVPANIVDSVFKRGTTALQNAQV